MKRPSTHPAEEYDRKGGELSRALIDQVYALGQLDPEEVHYAGAALIEALEDAIAIVERRLANTPLRAS